MSRRTGVVLLAEQALHETGEHPENGQRLPAVVEHLRTGDDWGRLVVAEPRSAEVEDLLRAHTADHVEAVRRAAETGPTWIDGDTRVSPESFRVALKAAGAALTAVDLVTGRPAGPPTGRAAAAEGTAAPHEDVAAAEAAAPGTASGHGGEAGLEAARTESSRPAVARSATPRPEAARSAAADRTVPSRPAPPASPRPDSLFALIRPPGHHARPEQAMGFCLFNNAAVAARYARERLGLERVAILDWDVHHGNGTQDALWDDPSILFVSLHQWPLYPGTGWVTEVGGGAGEGYTVNLPMPPGCGDAEYGQAMDAVVEPILDRYDPQLLIVSAGQDAHAADQLAGELLSIPGYHSLSRRAAEFAQDRGIGLVALHEGGYNLSTLPRLDHAILGGLGDFAVDLSDPSAGIGPQITDWPERLAEIRRAQAPYWRLP